MGGARNQANCCALLQDEWCTAAQGMRYNGRKVRRESLVQHAWMEPLGDRAIIVRLGERPDETFQRIVTLIAYLDDHPLPGQVEVVPGYTSVAIYYEPAEIEPLIEAADRLAPVEFPCPYDYVRDRLLDILRTLDARDAPPAREVEIPVCYGGDCGPDLEDVARLNGLTAQEVVEIHSSASYVVHMIGFAPGFPYLGGMDPRIAAPRRDAPRPSVPAGSVGIAGVQTGVYPIETPGGWNVIGRTPLKLFQPERDPPSLLRAGDIVRFRPISKEAYARWEGQA